MYGVTKTALLGLTKVHMWLHLHLYGCAVTFRRNASKGIYIINLCFDSSLDYFYVFYVFKGPSNIDFTSILETKIEIISLNFNYIQKHILQVILGANHLKAEALRLKRFAQNSSEY